VHHALCTSLSSIENSSLLCFSLHQRVNNSVLYQLATVFVGPPQFVLEHDSSNSRQGSAPGRRVVGAYPPAQRPLKKRYPDGLVVVPCFNLTAATKRGQRQQCLQQPLADALEGNRSVINSLMHMRWYGMLHALARLPLTLS
jgi:hypothetical protein